MVGDKNNKTWQDNKKNSVEIEAYLKPSWVLASTNSEINYSYELLLRNMEAR